MIELQDKNITLLSTKDPMTFQAVQAMSSNGSSNISDDENWPDPVGNEFEEREYEADESFRNDLDDFTTA